MMFLPGRKGFLTLLRQQGFAHCSVNPTDDLVVSLEAIKDYVKSNLGRNVRIFLDSTESLLVELRSD